MKKYEREMDKLFDEDNLEPIEIEGEDGAVYKFNQLALIPMEHGCYTVLKNVDPMEGVDEDEVFVFFIDEEQDELVYVDNEMVANEVLQELENMLDEE